MDVRLIANVLLRSRALRTREKWSRARITEHRESALAELRRFVYERSPFYQRFHRGVENRPLSALPVVTKPELMAAFDDVVTDRAVKLKAVRAFLDGIDGYQLFLERYWVARTSGSTGEPGVFLWNRREWSEVLASYSRAQAWAGIELRVLERVRLAVVSSRIPWHQSGLVGMSVDSTMLPVRRFDATEPIADIVRGLNDWQPENFICYASMGGALAEEQLAGRLRIGPRVVMCSSEVLTAEARARIRRAFGVDPYNVYAATETATIASECERHRMHLFEDLVIAEVVDEQYQPVNVGTVGSKLLVTVLFARTLPLIRYELSDTVSLSDEPCPCGRPSRVVETMEGRSEDALVLPTTGGGVVSLHPNLIHKTLESLAVAMWQVEQLTDGLLVRLVQPHPDVRLEDVAAAVGRAVRHAGAAEQRIEVVIADAPARTTLGKAPLIKALR